MSSLTQARREYLQKRPSEVIDYQCVQFSHPSFGDVYLVADQFFPKSFVINNVSIEHQPVSMRLPPTTDQVSDSTRASSLQFGRIGMDFRSKLRQMTSSNIFTPITVTLRIYQSDALVYERSLEVANKGISLNEESVTVKLTVPNYAKVTKKDRIYDPAIFIGLQNG